jgi:hypothetical protein
MAEGVCGREGTDALMRLGLSPLAALGTVVTYIKIS